MLQLAALFQSGMILQREKPVHIWGLATPGASVSAEIQGKRGEAIADTEGDWQLSIPSLAVSECERLAVSCQGESVVLEDVAVGEVWVAGGQSNMEFHMRYEKHKAEALERCENPRIRFYDVPEVCYDGQINDFDYSRMGIWRNATREDLEYFSAAGYYFQKELEQEMDVPVGIIGCNWGGTTSSAWMRVESVRQAGEPWIADYEERTSAMDMERYWQEQRTNSMNDRGNPFENPFSETVMPRTLSEEELKEFFASMPGDMADYINMLQPQEKPGCLYEHMLKTIAPVTIRGFLWYQGESDDVPGRNVLYADMLTALIADWRSLWADQSLPFLVVQLPGFDRWLLDPPNNEYQVIRRCQETVANTVDAVYLCSIADVGEERDIHPKDKRTVGHRLALLALGHVYGKDILCDAPVAAALQADGDRLVISFSNAKGGLTVQGETVNALTLHCGDTEVPFRSEVCGEQLVLYPGEPVHGEVSAVFAQGRWYQVNLFNQAGVPAIPFVLHAKL